MVISPMSQTSPTPAHPGSDDESVNLQIASALGRIPSGLFVITWRADEIDHVMLASWVMQAGFEPPLVSVAVGTSRELLAAVRGGARFVVNVLAESQRAVLARFGKPLAEGTDPFVGLAIERTADGLAAFADAPAWLVCRMAAEAVVSGGDHVVIVARVEAARGTPNTPPLVHVRRNGLKY
jgi:flavin reductase (DIM6/NTAB) family NADH-FMN oxidoreductase RutF